MRLLIPFIMLAGCYQVGAQWTDTDTEPPYDTIVGTESNDDMEMDTDTDADTDTDDPCLKIHECGFMTVARCYDSTDPGDWKCKMAMYNLEWCLWDCGCNLCVAQGDAVTDNCNYDWIWEY
jgi:hypothetical protein